MPDKPVSSNADALRTWTDDTGSYHVEAQFVATLGDGTVRLRMADGRYVRIAFERLGQQDRQFVRDLGKTVAMSW